MVTMFWASIGSVRVPSSSVGMPNMRGIRRGLARASAAVNGPWWLTTAMKWAMPGPSRALVGVA